LYIDPTALRQYTNIELEEIITTVLRETNNLVRDAVLNLMERYLVESSPLYEGRWSLALRRQWRDRGPAERPGSLGDGRCFSGGTKTTASPWWRHGGCGLSSGSVIVTSRSPSSV
jgi:hypothetical protein